MKIKIYKELIQKTKNEDEKIQIDEYKIRNMDFFHPPVVGKKFFLGKNIATGVVVEIIDEHKFRTDTAIYIWELNEE